jgi:hypothetical protein
MITEGDIKQAFIPFLKEFYKYRYEFRPETAQAAIDSISTQGNIVADGMLSFRRNDDSPFVCTYEATSFEKIEEVKYTLNTTYFLWDCLAFGGIFTSLIYAFLYARELPWLVGLGFVGNIGLLLGAFLLGFLSWYFTMQGWRKYRYIYAVEQFKQYFADEQWVVLAEDVFPAPTDPYLLELKEQCIYNGFGLALILENRSVRPIVTPTRLGIYGKDRKMSQWITQASWYQTVAANLNNAARYRPPVPGVWTKIRNTLVRAAQFYLLDPLKKGLDNNYGRPVVDANLALNRFMRARQTQKWIFLSMCVLNTYLMYKVLRLRDTDVADIAKVQLWRGAKYNPENLPMRYDFGEPIPDPGRGMVRQYPQPADEADEEVIQTINLSGDDDEPEAKKPLPPPPPKKVEGIEEDDEPTSGTGKAAISFGGISPCTAIHEGWYIQDGLFSADAPALDRLRVLRKRGITCFAVRQICLESDKTGVYVFLDKKITDEATANQTAANYGLALERYGLLERRLVVRQVASAVSGE